MKVTDLWGKKANKKSTKERIREAYETLAERYNERIDSKPHNAYYDRPNTLQLLGDVDGKLILDAACGPGKYAEILTEQGAEITGFDLSPNMVDLAKKRNPDRGEFFVHDLAKPLPQIPDFTFDKVLCALAMHYVEDWNPVIQEFHRVLKVNGEVVISIEHPFFEYTYFKSTKYFEIERVRAFWKGFGGRVEVPSYRRGLMDCIRPFTNNGFVIDALVEPLPLKEFEKLDPKHFKELNEFPAFMMIRALKK